MMLTEPDGDGPLALVQVIPDVAVEAIRIITRRASERVVRYAFEYAGPGGGFIMGSSHSLAVGATIENIMEMKRCRDEWGVYPLKPGSWT